MVRIFLAACFSLLLVGLQQESLIHALQHDRARMADARDVTVQTPNDAPCLLCSLLAGGTHAVASADHAAPEFASIIMVAAWAGNAIAAAAPVYYASRAPPLVL